MLKFSVNVWVNSLVHNINKGDLCFLSDGNKCLNRKIKEIKVSDNINVNYEANVISSNKEKGDFLYSFLPSIKAVGRDLKNESTNQKWTCGLYSSLLESKDKKERVIQVLIIWTRQRLFLKRFFSLILISLSILSIIQLSSIKSISDIWFLYSIYLISFTFIAFFLYYFP